MKETSSMNEHKGWYPELPVDLAAMTIQLSADICQGKSDQDAMARFCAWRNRLTSAGYTLESIANVLGITREGVRRRGKHCAPELVASWAARLPEVSTAPQSARQIRAQEKRDEAAARRAAHEAKIEKGTVPQEVSERLVSLRREAILVRGWTPQDSPQREASRQLNAELIALLDAGYTKYAVAKAAKLTNAGLNLRLSRAGYEHVAFGYTSNPSGQLLKELREEDETDELTRRRRRRTRERQDEP